MTKALANPKLFAATGLLFVIATLFNATSGQTQVSRSMVLAAPEAPTKGATLPPDMVCTPWTPCNLKAN